jgi:hypothetical protein
VSRIDSRTAGLAASLALVVGFLAYMVMAIPVAAPRLPNGQVLLFCPLAAPPLPRPQIVHYWPAALTGALIVIGVDAIAVTALLRRRRRAKSAPAAPSPTATTAAHTPLRLERVPLRAAVISALASLTLLAAGITQGYPMWVPVGLAVAPWIPVLAVEAVAKYEHYGAWAIFGVVVLLQIGHMGEHTVQVSQLLLYQGQLAQSHGVFGQLDFETIHFFWDSAIWVTLALLLSRFGANRWLWIAFAAASLHEVEHLYLYWMYLTHPWFYAHGGFEGIMGNGGLIGSPLARPYLHFAYNFLVVVPMTLAFWDQTKHLCDRVQRPGPRLDPPLAGPVPIAG